MRPHAKPDFAIDFDVQAEIEALDQHLSQGDRAIPQRSDDNLIIATWNMTNFGEQDREEEHLRLMAHIISPFDIVAIQELADDLSDFWALLEILGDSWDFFVTDIAGNKERLGYLYRLDRVTPTGLAAELAMRGYERRRIWIDGIDPEAPPFEGFNRNPYIFGFERGEFHCYLVNVHFYWTDVDVRQLETKALGKWAKSRLDKSGPPNNDIILIGDFNMPAARPGDRFYDQLDEFGVHVPKHTTNLVGTNLAGTADYDQIAFFPSRTQEDFTGRIGVYDFDNALFSDFYDSLGDEISAKRPFFQYMRYYIADHRPLWAEFQVD